MKILNIIKRKAAPSRQFQKELLSHLIGKNTMKINIFKTAAASMVAVVILAGGTMSTYAYYSPGVTDGDLLNGLKSGIEKMEGGLARSPEKRAEFHAKMMKRRVAEAEHLKKDNEHHQVVVERAATELGLSVDELKNNIKDPDQRKEIIEQLRDTNQGFLGQLHRIEERRKEASMDEEHPVKGSGRLPEELRDQIHEISAEIMSSEDLDEDEKADLIHEEIKGLLEDELDAEDLDEDEMSSDEEVEVHDEELETADEHDDQEMDTEESDHQDEADDNDNDDDEVDDELES